MSRYIATIGVLLLVLLAGSSSLAERYEHAIGGIADTAVDVRHEFQESQVVGTIPRLVKMELIVEIVLL